MKHLPLFVRMSLFASFLFSYHAFSSPINLRWTGFEDKNSNFLHVIEVVNQKTGFHLSTSDFLMIEDRELANNHFYMFIQTAGGLPLNQQTLRIWTDLKTKDLIQAEARVEGEKKLFTLSAHLKSMTTLQFPISPESLQNKLTQLAREEIQKSKEDTLVKEISFQDMWDHDQRVRVITAKAKYGKHIVKISLDNYTVLQHQYLEYPRAELMTSEPNSNDEFSLPAFVYPIYEESPGQLRQTRVIAQLKHIKKMIPQSTENLYSSLKSKHYYSDKNDPVLGLTLEGQANGFWSMQDVKSKAQLLRSNLPVVENSFSAGVILEGRYASVSIHPDAITAFTGLQFAPKSSVEFLPSWKPISNSDLWEMIPGSAFYGKPLMSYEEAYQRPARRLPNHNPVDYINDGFDEVQVYFAINTLFETFHEMGFTDPELSTRPFHAFLYDPEISMKDNAYYTDDTINFTTYSPGAQNFARDNSTIWHELGHGLMDRLMGDFLQLADTGGLSEGVADFTAALLMEKITKGLPFDGSEDFRIINKIGYSLTNEVHDDGEAYGGSLHDIMKFAEEKFGLEGVVKMSDLTLETMRLCRNNPGLTAESWFEHMLFADQLGHLPTRAPGEFRDLVISALAQRNFTLDGKPKGQFKITYGNQELDSSGPGSRGSPIKVSIKQGEKAQYSLKVSAIDGEVFKFKYPLTVRVQLQNGPLQGALHWDHEENKFVDFKLQNPQDVLDLNLAISGKCDFVNRQDGSCVDFAYIQIIQNGESSPIAKKRFYLRLMPQ